MNLIRNILFVLGVLVLSSCEEILMHPDPSTDNLSIFNEYAKICIEKYGLSEVKGIDINSLADSIRPLITNDLTQEDLFAYLSIITSRLREGHTYLHVPGTALKTGYSHFQGYPNADGFVKTQFYYGESVNPTTKYIGNSSNKAYSIKYGLLPQDTTIGFINVVTFQIDFSDRELETMLNDLS